MNDKLIRLLIEDRTGVYLPDELTIKEGVSLYLHKGILSLDDVELINYILPEEAKGVPIEIEQTN